MLQVFDLQKSFGQRVLFEGITFSLNPGDRVGLVGRNGSGKSTLFKILMGQESYDLGEVRLPKQHRIGYLQQHLKWTEKTVLEECALALPPEDKFSTYKVEKILFGLGFQKQDMERDPRSFSGGQQIRFNLCKVLVQNPDLLLLDEPTNYLDIVSMRWLSSFLQTFAGEVILITHDRSFMDKVCNSIMGIHRRRLRIFKGNTENFYQKLFEEEEIYEKTRINQERKIKKTEELIDRFRAKASKASMAQSRIKMLEKMQGLEALGSENILDFSFVGKDCPGKFLVEASQLSFSWSVDSPPLFSGLTFALKKEDRVGIIGKNGKGKTTLLNVIGGFLPTQGEIKFHPSVEVGFFGQTNIDRLSAENTVLQEIMSAHPIMGIQRTRDIAGTMMFSGDDGEKKIKVLSGGERARVLLGKILAHPSNLLLLDEPTNHLDQDSVESLIEGLRDFPGAAMVVTHNEELLHELCNKLIVFNGGEAFWFDGTYDDFLRRIGWDDEKGGESQSISKGPKRERGQVMFERNQLLKPIREKIQKLEKQIHPQENLLKKKKEELLEASMNNKGQVISQLSKEIPALESAIESLVEELFVLEEEKLAIEDKYKSELE